VKDLLLLWAVSLPIGYAIVARYYPEKRLSWRDLAGMTLLVVVWPMVLMALFNKDDDP
jgi:hypothetical protein